MEMMTVSNADDRQDHEVGLEHRPEEGEFSHEPGGGRQPRQGERQTDRMARPPGVGIAQALVVRELLPVRIVCARKTLPMSPKAPRSMTA